MVSSPLSVVLFYWERRSWFHHSQLSSGCSCFPLLFGSFTVVRSQTWTTVIRLD